MGVRGCGVGHAVRRTVIAPSGDHLLRGIYSRVALNVHGWQHGTADYLFYLFILHSVPTLKGSHLMTNTSR